MNHNSKNTNNFYQLSPEEQAVHLETLTREALKLYDIDNDAELKLLSHRENAVFSVNTKDIKYALRIHRYNYHSDAALRSELQWMESLNSFGVQTPPVVKGKNGDSVFVVSVDGVPEPRQIDVLSWVPGTPPKAENIIESFFTLGTLNAKMHQHAEIWNLPEGFTRHKWDEKGMLGTEALWGRYHDLEGLTGAQLQLLHKAKEIAQAKLEFYGKSNDRFGLIHADMMPENIMVNGSSVRVIDFDDGGFGWFMYDFGTSLYFNLAEPFYKDIYQSWLKGYQSVRVLSNEDIDMLPTFLMCRGLVALGWLHTRRETSFAQEITKEVIELTVHVAQGYVDSKGTTVGTF